jgi:hypothetical protein
VSEVYQFKTVENAPLKIWRKPREGVKYSIGADVSSGVSADWTVFNVLSNIIPFEQVAVWRAKMQIAQAAQELVKLGWYYNKAMLTIETNGCGAGLQDGVVATHRYPNCYRREDINDSDPNISSKFGWATTQTTKWLLIRDFQQAWKNKEIILHDPQTINELLNYVYIEDKSKTGATEGLNDDCVISLLLALHTCSRFPQRMSEQSYENISGDNQARVMMRKYMEGVLAAVGGTEKREVL